MRTMLLAICLMGCSIEFRDGSIDETPGLDDTGPGGVGPVGPGGVGPGGMGGAPGACAPCPEEPRRLATGDGCEQVYTYRPREDDPCRCWLTITLECGAGGAGASGG